MYITGIERESKGIEEESKERKRRLYKLGECVSEGVLRCKDIELRLELRSMLGV